jgi:hypothetical protein
VLYLIRAYDGLAGKARPKHNLHDWLRPRAGVGLLAGLVAVSLVLAILAYLVRKCALPNLLIGILAAWVRVDVVTGLLTPLLLMVHAAAAPRETVGGHGLWTLVALVVSGTIGRSFYSVQPRTANGAELAQLESCGNFATPQALLANIPNPMRSRPSCLFASGSGERASLEGSWG